MNSPKEPEPGPVRCVLAVGPAGRILRIGVAVSERFVWVSEEFIGG